MLVTGPTGSGKSSTLAAIIDLINETRAEHILTIEDPIEFLHRHKKATVHQRELHSDTPTFALALRAALRQAPKVILVGEMRDRETIEIALTAAETGHLVFSTLHTIDASKTVERIIGTFDAGDQQAVRDAPGGVVPLLHLAAADPAEERRPRRGARDPEVDDAHARVHREGRDRRQDPARRDARRRARRHADFDGEIEKLVRAGAITFATGHALRDQRRQPAGCSCSTSPTRSRRRHELPDDYGPLPPSRQCPPPSPCRAQGPIRTGDITLRGLTAADFPRMTKLADNVYAYEQIDPTKRTVTVNNLIVVTTDGVLIAESQGTVDNVQAAASPTSRS